MNRTILTSVTKETSEAEVNGWKLNFTTESTNESLKTIQVNGTKSNNYFSANRQEGGQISNSFSNGIDVGLLSEVVAEFDSIVAGFTTPVEEE